MVTAFINGIILSGQEDMTPVGGKSIIVEDKKIKAIISNDDLSQIKPDRIIDLKGSYIMPGLINLHVHLAGSGKPKKKAGDPKKSVALITANGLMRAIGRKMVAGYARTELLSGTTTIRTVGGIANFDTKIRDDINRGKKIGPRILASNMAISVPGGHMAGSLGYEATSCEDAVRYVDIIAKNKPDIIKLMITGGVMDAEVVGEPGVLRMAPELVRAACDRAHELGFKVAAHVESPAGVRVALENGVDSIEHGAKPDSDTMDLFRKNNAFQVSTISPAIPYALFDRSISGATEAQQANGMVVFNGIVDMAKECLKNGIPVGLGTDVPCPYITHYNMWRELYNFSKYCNVTPAFALYSATALNARLAQIDHITGSITQGLSADMIVTKGNPLTDLRALRDIEMVVFEGTIHAQPKVKKYPEVEAELDKFL